MTTWVANSSNSAGPVLVTEVQARENLIARFVGRVQVHSQMLRPEVRCRRIWLHDCSLCRVLYFARIAGHSKSCVKKSCAKKAAT